MNLQKQILILTTAILTASVVPAFASKLDTIKKCAVLKKQIFRWELATLRDLGFMEGNLKQLKNKRARIQRKIEELEFMLKSGERIKQVSSSKFKEK